MLKPCPVLGEKAKGEYSVAEGRKQGVVVLWSTVVVEGKPPSGALETVGLGHPPFLHFLLFRH